VPIYGYAPLVVNFTDTSSPDITAWLWTFGDGSTTTSQSPSHTYSSDGTYQVSLTATGPLGTLSFYDFVYVGAVTAEWTQPDPAYAVWPGGNPQVSLRLSNDGGKTWGPETQRSAGKTGEYFKRIRWNRLGQGRKRVFEIVVTDPIPWRVVGAYLEASRNGRPA